MTDPLLAKLAHLAAFLASGQTAWPGGNHTRLHGPDYAELRLKGWIRSDETRDENGRPLGRSITITETGLKGLETVKGRTEA